MSTSITRKIGRLLVGCLLMFTGAVRASSPSEDANCDIYETIVVPWKNLGIDLPKKADIEVFAKNLPRSIHALRKGMTHDSQHVRLCTAYVVRELGSAVKVLSPDLRTAYSKEAIPYVRSYFAWGLGATGDSSDVNIAFLRKSFESESDGQARTFLAGAMVILRGVDKEEAAWEWILNSFSVPDVVVRQSEEKTTGHWDRCFAALFVIDDLKRGTGPAEIKLDELKQAESTPVYIQQKINEVLGQKEYERKERDGSRKQLGK